MSDTIALYAETSALHAETEAGAHERLVGQLGVFQISSMVIAFSAPLAVVAGYLAVVIAVGNGLGAPMAFALMGGVLLLFSIGFTQIVKALPACGGFYIYITAGLGRKLGLAGTLVAILAYLLLAAGTYAFFGLTLSRLVSEQLGGPELPWWFFVAIAWGLSTVLAYRELNVSARLLVISIILEFALMFAFDGLVLVRSGLQGLSLEPFQLRHLFSGSPGLAFLFATSVFLGFESTAIYRNEARRPERTIPRAAYLTVAFMTLFYCATTYFLIMSLGVNDVLAIAAKDPARTFNIALTKEMGRAGSIMGYMLLCTSLYSAALSIQNVLSRYIFKLATTGIIWERLGHLHPRYQAPSAASVASSMILALLMVPFAILGASPELLYARLVGVGAFSIIMLLFLTSLAIMAFFMRQGQRKSVVRNILAPFLAAACLLAIFVLANRNFVAMIGSSDALAELILAAVYGTVVIGVIWATWLKKAKPVVFEQIGQD